MKTIVRATNFYKEIPEVTNADFKSNVVNGRHLEGPPKREIYSGIPIVIHNYEWIKGYTEHSLALPFLIERTNDEMQLQIGETVLNGYFRNEILERNALSEDKEKSVFYFRKEL